MKLVELSIQNYKSIGEIPCKIRINDIVVLIGQNNAGKSTILDAYEVFASSGKPLDLHSFHQANPNNKISITGIFNKITTKDKDIIGNPYIYMDEEYGECIKYQWKWNSPDEKAKKLSFNPEKKSFEEGGMGGWDSLIASCIPTPIRMRPTDSVNITQEKILEMIKPHVKNSIKNPSKKTEDALKIIEELTNEIFQEAQENFDQLSTTITKTVQKIFPLTQVNIVPQSKNPINEKIIAADSYISVSCQGQTELPLVKQGTGIQRVLLWSILAVMTGADKKTKKGGGIIQPKILLIDEPEAFLHPPMIRSAREALYEFALQNNDWQVLATTHSPIFIDVSKEHTTIIRVDSGNQEPNYISTDEIDFSRDDRNNLQMIRDCNPFVNEFFFFDDIYLVEGPTEQLVLYHVAKLLEKNIHVIDCKGKNNIPRFAKILNHFKTNYTIIHDSDTPKTKRKSGLCQNGVWTTNKLIREEVLKVCGVGAAVPLGKIYTQFPHFEGQFIDLELTNGKVDNIINLLNDSKNDICENIIKTYKKIINKEESVFNTSEKEFENRKNEYLAKENISNRELWLN